MRRIRGIHGVCGGCGVRRARWAVEDYWVLGGLRVARRLLDPGSTWSMWYESSGARGTVEFIVSVDFFGFVRYGGVLGVRRIWGFQWVCQVRGARGAGLFLGIRQIHAV